MTIVHCEAYLALLVVQLDTVPRGGTINFDHCRVRYIVVDIGHQIEAKLVRA